MMKDDTSLQKPIPTVQKAPQFTKVKIDTTFAHGIETRLKKDFKEINVVKDILLPSIGLPALLTIFGLFIAIKTLLNSYKLARVNFEFQLIQSHRDIWSKIHSLETGEELVSPTAMVRNLTEKETRYLVFLILNTKIGYEARRSGVLQHQKSIMRDIGDFYSRPLLNKLWNDIKNSYEKPFVEYIDKCIVLANQHPVSKKPILLFLKQIGSAMQSFKFRKKPINQTLVQDTEDLV